MRRGLGPFGALACAALLIACGDDGRFKAAPPPSAVVGDPFIEPRPAPTVASTGEVAEVQAIDNTFRADTIEIAAGTEVRWQNLGRNQHDIRPVTGSGWGVGAEEFIPGAVYSYVFSKAGDYPYYCTLHGTQTAGMVGKVVVTGPRH